MNYMNPKFRKYVALALLAIGIGWVVSREVRARRRHAITVVVMVPPLRRGPDSRLWIRVETVGGEDLLSRESVVRTPSVRTRTRLLPGRYKVLVELRTSTGSMERQAVFDVPGPEVRIEFP